LYQAFLDKKKYGKFRQTVSVQGPQYLKFNTDRKEADWNVEKDHEGM